MPQQGVQYIVTLADMTNGGFNKLQQGADSADASVLALNGSLRSLAGAFGLGFGIHSLIDAGKDLVKVYAEYEQSLLRIKNVSSSLTEGITNQRFIFDEAMKFKIPIEEATDAYGEFLTMVRGSGLAGDSLRKLHDDVLTIGKVTAIPSSQMDASVRNLGKLLEEGKLEGRHLRPLSYQLSGLMPYIASELGMKSGELSSLIAKGIGKVNNGQGIDSKVLLDAMSKYAADLKTKLPDALNTTQSALNDLHNAWFMFKTGLAEELRPQIIGLVTDLKDGATWLRENKKEIIQFGSALVNIGKIWLVYRSGMLLVNAAQATYSAFMAGYAGQTATVVAGAEAQAVAFNSLAVAMERVAFATEVMAGASMTGAVGLGKFGIPLAGAGAAAGVGVGAGEAAALGGISVVSGALLVALAAGSIVALGMALAPKNKAARGFSEDEQPINPLIGRWKTERTGNMQFGAGADTAYDLADSKADTFYQLRKVWVADTLAQMSEQQRNNKEISDKLAKLFPETAKGGKINPVTGKKESTLPEMTATDRISGSRPVTYNITIPKITGMEVDTLNIADATKVDIEQLGRKVADAMLSAVNDSQIRQGN